MLQDTPSFLAYWRNARSRPGRVLGELAPADLEWAPVPGAFSCGDQPRHLAGLERFMWAETVTPLFGLTEEPLAAASKSAEHEQRDTGER